MNEDQHLENIITEVLVEKLGVTKEALTLEARLDDLARDSIQLFELIVAFEKRFGVAANYDELIAIETVGDVLRYLKEKKVA